MPSPLLGCLWPQSRINGNGGEVPHWRLGSITSKAPSPPFLALRACVLSHSVVSNSLWPYGLILQARILEWVPCPPPGDLQLKPTQYGSIPLISMSQQRKTVRTSNMRAVALSRREWYVLFPQQTTSFPLMFISKISFCPSLFPL